MNLDPRIIQCFDHLNYDFHSIHFHKDDIMITPLEKNTKILFITSGTVAVYSLSPQGNRKPVGMSDGFIMMGDVEFVCKENPFYFVEAKSEVEGIYIDFEKEKDKLNQDITFLHHVLNCLVDKVKLQSFEQTEIPTIDERVLNYFTMHNTMENIEKTSFQLRCSKRQLLRILKKMCEDNTIIKIKKGVYKKI